MRPVSQFTRTPREWHDDQAVARERHLRAFLAMCRDARARQEQWIRWIDDGCPPLTREQYQAQHPERARGQRRAPAGALA